MVDRVTQEALHEPHEPMEDEKITRLAQWKRGLVAESHVLTKLVGDSISASWSVTNTGGLAATGFLDILFLVPGTAFTGPAVSIPPGATVTLEVSGVISTLVPGTTYASQVRVRAFAPATVAPGGVHDFTLTISAPATAILSASPAGPTII